MKKIICLLIALASCSPAYADFYWGTSRAEHFKGTDGADEMHGNGGADRLEGLEGPDNISGGNDAHDPCDVQGRFDDILYANLGRDTIHYGPCDYGNLGESHQLPDKAIIHKAGIAYPRTAAAMVNRFWPGVDRIAVEGGLAGLRVLSIVAEGNQVFGAHFLGGNGERFFVRLDPNRRWFAEHGDHLAFIRTWFAVPGQPE